MVFSGIPFLYFFLPMVLLLYYGSPRQAKNYVLLASGIVFYFYGEQLLVFLMLFTAFWDYSMARLIDFKRSHARWFLLLALIVDVGILCYFKYTDFFIEVLNSGLGTNISLLKIALPIGISFYTFQSMSYVIDVYRGEVPVQKNPLTYATYLTLFPQLIAGPIVRYSTVLEELKGRTHTISQFADGIRRFVVGLSKKVLVANVLGEFCRLYPELAEKTVLLSWFYACSYTLQIYFDFSGYSDMAIGLGKMFGFRFLENFDYPLISRSITEFWRRWHISLGTWFRDYVYIPLGGRRRRWLFNVLLVWFLTGMWHGAGWNFILWGLYNALFLVLEKGLRNRLSKSSAVLYFYSIPVILVGFMIFAGSDIDAVAQIKNMFFLSGNAFIDLVSLYYIRDFFAIFIIAIIAATPLGMILFEKLLKSRHGKVFASIATLGAIALFCLSTAEIVDSSFNPFLYFRF